MPNRLQLLVVDDDENFNQDFEIIGKAFFRMNSCVSGEAALQILKNLSPDAIILDLRLGEGMDGIQTLKLIRNDQPDIPVIMVTDYASVETAVEAMKLGAVHYMSKKPNMKALHAIIHNELKNAAWKRLYLEEIRTKYGKLVGESKVMKSVRKQIIRAAPGDSTVLIEGETGTGKELVAREIHARSNRNDKPFIVVNCAAITETLAESELFGHEKGAFTGANFRKKGKFEESHTGTLFLDEISAMQPALQAKLLRAVENHSFERIGGNETISIDVRIIAASNRNLHDLIADGLFREDLYYRLNVMNIHVPPLRERTVDIQYLASYFCNHFVSKWGRDEQRLSPEALDALKRYKWPGNARELRNVIERTLILTTNTTIQPGELKLDPV